MIVLPRRVPPILPLSRALGLMAWVIAIMIFLCALSLAAGLSITTATRNLAGELDHSLTVQIAEANPDLRARQAKAVVRAIGGLDGVAAVREVPAAELSRMLEPWLGTGLAAGDLPIPALIDVTLEDDAAAIKGRVAAAARGVSPGARIDDHGGALGPLGGLLGTLRALAAVVALLVVLAAVAVVALATRSSLNTHMATIEVMHLIGARDEQIARIFRRRAAMDGLVGGAIGLACAVLVVLLLGDQASALGSGLLAAGSIGIGSWAVLLALPVLAGLLALATAHLTVIRLLALYA
jgi:cell division transport system permease protein